MPAISQKINWYCPLFLLSSSVSSIQILHQIQTENSRCSECQVALAMWMTISSPPVFSHDSAALLISNNNRKPCSFIRAGDVERFVILFWFYFVFDIFYISYVDGYDRIFNDKRGIDKVEGNIREGLGQALIFNRIDRDKTLNRPARNIRLKDLVRFRWLRLQGFNCHIRYNLASGWSWCLRHGFVRDLRGWRRMCTGWWCGDYRICGSGWCHRTRWWWGSQRSWGATHPQCRILSIKGRCYWECHGCIYDQN